MTLDWAFSENFKIVTLIQISGVSDSKNLTHQTQEMGDTYHGRQMGFSGLTGSSPASNSAWVNSGGTSCESGSKKLVFMTCSRARAKVFVPVRRKAAGRFSFMHDRNSSHSSSATIFWVF